MAQIEVPANYDLVKIAELAGGYNAFERKYVNGILYVDGVTQEALDDALAAYDHAATEVEYLRRVLANYRYEKENAGITVSGVTIQTDLGTRTNLLGAKALGTSIKWKTPSGFVTLTAQQVSDIADAVGLHVQKCFDAEAAVDLTDLTTPEEVEAAFDAAYET